jgi:hypothetical protein
MTLAPLREQLATAIVKLLTQYERELQGLLVLKNKRASPFYFSARE